MYKGQVSGTKIAAQLKKLMGSKSKGKKKGSKKFGVKI